VFAGGIISHASRADVFDLIWHWVLSFDEHPATSLNLAIGEREVSGFGLSVK
jgi:hypothetical protein